MSDTPRTNAESFFPHDSKYQVCDADFCRQLERELNAAKENARLQSGGCARNQNTTQFCAEAVSLAEKVKRLEDTGDYLCAAAAFMGWHDKVEAWNKAKESKQ